VVVDGINARSIGYPRGGVMRKHEQRVIRRVSVTPGVLHRFGAGCPPADDESLIKILQE
jgi:hypothetical protein